MADTTPYAMLTGSWKFWIAVARTAKPDLDDATLTGWTALGNTEGEQTFKFEGSLTPFYDNHSTAARKYVRPVEGFVVQASLAHLTLEDRAIVASMATAVVVTATSGAPTVKQLPLKRGFNPTKYALLARGGAIVASNTMSPYGAWPAQFWIPEGVFDGEPEETYAKDGTPVLQFMFRATADDTQAAGYEFGMLEAQSQ